MKRVAPTAALSMSLLLTTPAAAAELQVMRYATVVYACDGVLRTASLPNASLQPLRIKKALLWHGMDQGKRAAIVSEIVRPADGTLVVNFYQHRWAEPTGVIHVLSDFGDDYIRIGAGESLTINYSCAPVSSGAFSAAIHASLWYTVE